MVGTYEKEGLMMINIVAILVKKAALEFDKIANPYFAEYDLTASQYRIIKYLYAQPSRATRVVDLERQYSMTHPTTIGLLFANLFKRFYPALSTSSLSYTAPEGSSPRTSLMS